MKNICWIFKFNLFALKTLNQRVLHSSNFQSEAAFVGQQFSMHCSDSSIEVQNIHSLLLGTLVRMNWQFDCVHYCCFPSLKYFTYLNFWIELSNRSNIWKMLIIMIKSLLKNSNSKVSETKRKIGGFQSGIFRIKACEWHQNALKFKFLCTQVLVHFEIINRPWSEKFFDCKRTKI